MIVSLHDVEGQEIAYQGYQRAELEQSPWRDDLFRATFPEVERGHGKAALYRIWDGETEVEAGQLTPTLDFSPHIAMRVTLFCA